MGEDDELDTSSISDLVNDSELTRGTPDEEESSIELSVVLMWLSVVLMLF